MTTNILNTTDRVMKNVQPMETKLLEYEEFTDDHEKINFTILINHLQKEGRLHPNAVIRILERTQSFLQCESNMITVEGETAIFGDLHGQFYDLLSIYQDFTKSNEKLLFLGDYVDRGCFGTEVCLLLFCLKISYPWRINLLRGNHECRVMTTYFNFRQECLWKYNKLVYDYFMDTFDCLPLCALVKSPLGNFFCVHGGISPSLHRLEDVQKINRFQEPPEEGLMCDLLWSDPLDDSDYEEYSVGEKIEFQKEMFSFNSQRGCSFYYGFNAVRHFLAQNDVVCIVRAHEVQENGCKMNFQCCCETPVAITIFTAPNYCDSYENDAAVLMIENEELSFLSYNNVPHPFWLPRFSNAFTYTIDSLFREISSIASTILTSSVVDLLNEEDDFSSTPELETKDNEIVIGNVVINIDNDYISDHSSHSSETPTLEKSFEDEIVEGNLNLINPPPNTIVSNPFSPKHTSESKLISSSQSNTHSQLKQNSPIAELTNTNENNDDKPFLPMYFSRQNPKNPNVLSQRKTFAHLTSNTNSLESPPAQTRRKLSAQDVRELRRSYTMNREVIHDENGKTSFQIIPLSQFALAKQQDLKNEYRPIPVGELKEFWKNMKEKK